jgi:branched-chain amino acid transport system substrate-binding protein
MANSKATKKSSPPPPIVFILLFLGLGFGGYWWSQKTSNPSNSSVSPNSQVPSLPNIPNILNVISIGDKILISDKLTPDKQAGVESMAQGNWNEAIAKFQASLQQNPNDPEALIYLNNAKIGNNNALKIAVSIPIGSNLDVAQEILRGVAQAQDEINRSGGINGIPIKVAIADDRNDPNLAAQIAAEFAKDNKILAVVGHNASNVSLAVAPIYQQNNLVAISPTSNAVNLSGIGSYIFRTIPNLRNEAFVLAQYATKTKNLATIAICNDSTSVSSQSLKAEFTDRVVSNGVRIANTPCDFAAIDFSPDRIIPKFIAEGADGLLLLPNIDKINAATDMARANQGKLSLIGSSTMNTHKTLQLGQKDVNGMVINSIWHPDIDSANPFAKNAQKLWSGIVNWRTATSYDAMQTIIAGLRQNPTRSGLQQVISQQGFSVNGATGIVKFLPSGDRADTNMLLKIQPSNSSTGYDFAPMQ